MRTMGKTTALLLLIAIPAYSQQGVRLQDAIDTLNAGYDNWSSEKMEEARGMLLRSGNNDVYTAYFIALADYRLATYYLREKKDRASSLVNEGEAYIKSVMDSSNEMEGELCALKAGLVNTQIAIDPSDAATLGFEVTELLSKASSIDGKSPRVWLYKGFSQFYTPPAYGGGAERARASFEEAVKLFESGKAVAHGPVNYGYDEALTWIGMTYMKEKKIDQAKEMFGKALKVNPLNGLARSQVYQLSQ